MTERHWEAVYQGNALGDMSWHELFPATSLKLIADACLSSDDPIIDVGGGGSRLVDELIAAGYRDLSVLDISSAILWQLEERLRHSAARVMLLNQDVAAFYPTRHYALWHDRALFHFLVKRAERERYFNALRRALRRGGHLIMSVFGPRGPEECSGLPTARYGALDLAAELGKGFELIESQLLLHRTPRNALQQFLYCRFFRRS